MELTGGEQAMFCCRRVIDRNHQVIQNEKKVEMKAPSSHAFSIFARALADEILKMEIFELKS